MENDVDEKIRLSFKRAIAYGKARGLSMEQSEDLAQRWVVKVFVERTGQRLEQAYTDFLRFEFGDTRTISGLAKSEGRRKHKDIDERTIGGEPPYSQDIGFGDDTRKRKLILLNYKEICILDLLQSGMQQVDIAERLSVTESRVSQMVAAIKDKLSVFDVEIKPFEIDWITL
jgi:predicted DNA-binding protein (UPF0251 family)